MSGCILMRNRKLETDHNATTDAPPRQYALLQAVLSNIFASLMPDPLMLMLAAAISQSRYAAWS